LSSSAADIDDILDEDEDGDDDAKSSSSKKATSSSSKGSSSFDDEDGEGDEGGDSADVESSGSSSDDVVSTGACETKANSTEQKALDVAYPSLFDVIAAQDDGDADGAKGYSSTAKTNFTKILGKYPKSCAAQFGYAVSSLFDLYYNSSLGDYVDSFNDAFDATENLNGLKRLAKVLNTVGSGETSLTADIQNELSKKALPALDSAIAYMQNVVAQKNYALQFDSDGDTRELDKSEFGIVLGAAYGIKASVISLVSMNLDFDKDGSYSWISDYADVNPSDAATLNAKKTAAVKQMMSLIGKESLFTSVKTDYATKWKSVPKYLDSALIYVKAGLEFSRDEAMSGEGQEYDVYVVGNGADADISLADIKDAIADVKQMQADLKEGLVTFEISDDLDVTIDVNKFFANTKGLTRYLPYYTFEDYSDFDTFYFTDAEGEVTASLRDYQGDKFKKFTLSNTVGKIIFPDPSFGGIFPDFESQRDIWQFIIDLDAL